MCFSSSFPAHPLFFGGGGGGVCPFPPLKLSSRGEGDPEGHPLGLPARPRWRGGWSGGASRPARSPARAGHAAGRRVADNPCVGRAPRAGGVNPGACGAALSPGSASVPAIPGAGAAAGHGGG